MPEVIKRVVIRGVPTGTRKPHWVNPTEDNPASVRPPWNKPFQPNSRHEVTIERGSNGTPAVSFKGEIVDGKVRIIHLRASEFKDGVLREVSNTSSKNGLFWIEGKF